MFAALRSNSEEAVACWPLAKVPGDEEDPGRVLLFAAYEGQGARRGGGRLQTNRAQRRARAARVVSGKGCSCPAHVPGITGGDAANTFPATRNCKSENVDEFERTFELRAPLRRGGGCAECAIAKRAYVIEMSAMLCGRIRAPHSAHHHHFV